MKTRSPSRRAPKKERPAPAPAVPIEQRVAVMICKFANGNRCLCAERGGALCDTVMGFSFKVCNAVHADRMEKAEGKEKP